MWTRNVNFRALACATVIRSLVPVLVLVGTCLLPTTVNAQPPAPKKPAAKKPAAKKPANGGEVTPAVSQATPATPFEGNASREFTIAFKGFNDKSMTYTGDVVVTSLETQLKCDSVIFDRTTQTATCGTKLQFDDVQQSLLGEKGMADYKTQMAKLEGGATAVLRALPENGKRELGTLTSDMLDYNWKERTLTATGNTSLKLQGKTLSADKIEFMGKEEKVVLTGNVVITMDSGDKMQAGKAVLVLRAGAEETTLEEGQTATLKVTDGGTP